VLCSPAIALASSSTLGAGTGGDFCSSNSDPTPVEEFTFALSHADMGQMISVGKGDWGEMSPLRAGGDDARGIGTAAVCSVGEPQGVRSLVASKEL
jgi:hypothetical protein